MAGNRLFCGSAKLHEDTQNKRQNKLLNIGKNCMLLSLDTKGCGGQKCLRFALGKSYHTKSTALKNAVKSIGMPMLNLEQVEMPLLAEISLAQHALEKRRRLVYINLPDSLSLLHVLATQYRMRSGAFLELLVLGQSTFASYAYLSFE